MPVSFKKQLNSFEITEIKEQLLVAKFISSLPQGLSTELHLRRPSTLSQCIQICNALQMGKSSGMQSSPPAISKIAANPSTKPHHNHSKRCYRCGSDGHLASSTLCPAKDAICKNCQRKGHFQHVCLQKTSTSVRSIEVGVVALPKSIREKSTKPHIEVEIEADDRFFQQTCLLATGADVSILPTSVYESNFRKQPLN